jgi:hypothetical protein
MDTSKLSKTNSIYSAVRLVELHALAPKDELRQLAQGEYLIHGRLTNDDSQLWQAVEFDRFLQDNKLRELSRSLELYRYENRLLQGIIMMRNYYFRSDAQPFSLGWIYYRPIKALAQCFTGSWRSIVTFALVTLRCRDLSSIGDCMDVLRAEIAAGEVDVPNITWTSGMRRLKILLIRVPEGKHFMELLQILCDQRLAERGAN